MCAQALGLAGSESLASRPGTVLDQMHDIWSDSVYFSVEPCSSDVTNFLARLLARLRPVAGPVATAPPPSLPLLEYVQHPRAANWLCTSVTTFWENVASFLPGHFEAYARIYHPFGYGNPTAVHVPSWRELSASAGVDLSDPTAAMEFAYCGWEGGQARTGSIPEAMIGPMVEHLGRATTTPERCFFALWEGHGDSPVPLDLEPTLELPDRRYHIFAGPIEGVQTNFAASLIGHQSPNLWWPEDQAWCVATEIDFAWTYVGGTRSCIDALLADPRLEAVETTAAARL